MLDVNYKVVFQDKSPIAFTVKANNNQANSDGYTDAIRPEWDNLDHIANAGYKDGYDFAKKVKDADGNYVSSTTVTDKDAAIWYELSFKLPDNMSTITSLKLQDTLPAELDLTNVSEVIMKINGANPDAGTGTLNYDSSSRILSYTFDSAKFADVAGKTVTMEVPVKLSSSLTAAPNGNIVNKGELVIDRNPTTPPINPPIEVDVRGSISGILWADENADGTIDAAEVIRYAGETVKLYAEDSAGSGTYSDTGKTATTGLDGTYAFEELLLDVNYKVVFPDKNPIEFSAKANSNHANSDGYTDAIRPEWDNLDHTANAGYKDGFGFGKMVKDTEGNYVLNTTLTNKDEVIWYELRFKLPDNMSTIESVSIRDILPEQLELTNVTEIIVQIDGADPAAGIGMLNYEDATRLLSYEFDSSRLAELAGKTVTIEIPVKLNSSLTGAPDGQIINKGELIINDKVITPSVDPIIDVEISGTISGILWADENEDGILDSSEVIRYAGETVKLYAEDAPGSNTYSDTGLTAVTGDNGRYMFEELDADINYKLYFPDKTPIGYTVKQNDSHAGADGFSDAVMLTINEQALTVNAGYKDGYNFAKKVKDADGNYVSSTTVTDKDATIWYELSFKLPDNMSTITSLKLQDTLPAELDLTNVSEVIMKINGANPAAGTGVLNYENSARVLSYTFDSAKLADVAGKTVTMEVPVKLSSSLIAAPAGNIVNKGELVINSNPTTPPIDPPIEVDVRGSISGILWADENADGTIDAAEVIRYAGETVKLYVEDSAGSGTYSDTGKTAVTDTSGAYQFEELLLDVNYKVVFPDKSPIAFTTKSSNNHANSDGYTDAIKPEWDNLDHTANAGYKDGYGFAKKVKDADGNYVNSTTITDKNATIWYELSFKLPDNMSTITSLKLQDTLPVELDLTNIADVIIKTGGTEVAAGTGLLNYDNSSRILSYTFDSAKFAEVAGKTVTMEVPVKLSSSLTAAPAGNIVNKGELVINSNPTTPPIDPPIEVDVRGSISGILWADENADGIIDAAEVIRYVGETVRLYVEDSAGSGTYSDTGKTATTDANGAYKFEELLLDVNYKVVFPDKSPIAFTVNANDSHAGADGYTNAIKPEWDNLDHIANAGYKDGYDFAKKVKDADGNYVSSTTVTDKDATIWYELSFKLPDNMSTITSLKLQDTLPAELDLTNVSEVIMKINGANPAAGTGVLNYESSTKVLSYTFDSAKLADVAGKTVTMEVPVKLSSSLTAAPAGNIVNKGELIVNSNPTTPPIDPPIEIDVRGSISGILWADENADGTIDAAEVIRYAGETVKLYAEDSAGSGTYSDTGKTAVTDPNGAYQFEELLLDVNYKVLFPDKNPIEFSAKANGNHANSDGYTDAIRPEWDDLDHTANAGYKDGFGFGKMVKDAEGNYVLNTTLTNKDELIWYELRFKLPDNMSTIESVSIRDILPEQLQLTDVSEIIIKIDGADPAAGIGTLNYEEAARLLSYEFDSSRLAELAGKTVTIEIPVKLNSSLTGAPDGQIINKGELIINDKVITPPVDPIIDVEISGTISGILWADENEDGILDSSEVIRYAGETVKLYAEDSAGSGTYSDTGLTAVTGDNGRYIFYDLDGDINYKVYFPDKTPIGYTVKQNDSHAGADGFSDAVMLTIDEQTLTVNAGYKDGFRFAKKVKDADGNYVNSTTVTEKDATIWYELSFKLPDNMSTITSLRIQDTLPIELDLANIADVIVKVGETEAAKGTGNLNYENSTRVLSYQFDNMKLEQLAGQTVTMEVPVKLSSSLTGIPAGSIVNKGALVINDNNTTPPVDPPIEVDVRGSIRGILWADENEDGIIDAAEVIRYAGETIKLYAEDSAGSGTYSDTGKTAVTEADGTYLFEELVLDVNYKVLFPDKNPIEFTTKANDSHVNSDGYTDAIMLVWNGLEQEANAGYKDGFGFAKKVKDADGNYVNSTTVTDKNATIWYELSFKLPDNMSTISALKLQDTLPSELDLTNTADVIVKIGENTPADGAGMLNYESSTRILSYQFDSTKLADIAGQTVTMEVPVKLSSSLTGAPSGNIVNKGELIINDDTTNPPVDPPVEVDVRGSISGILWADENEDGVIDTTEVIRYAGETVKLYAEDSAGSGTYSDTGKTVVTDAAGAYRFEDLLLDTNYKVIFSDKSPIVFTAKANDSHANPDGYSDVIMLVWNNMDQEANAGYRDGFGFAKKVKDADDNYVNSATVTDRDATIWYELSFKLPDNMETITDLKVQDTLPAELDLTNVSEVIMKLSGTAVNTATGILNYDSDTRVLSYTFDSAEFAGLAGMTVTMEVPVKLSSSLTAKPSGSIVNKGELIVNKNTTTPPIDPPIEVDVRGSISGILWADENENGTMEAAEVIRYAGETVKLYAEDGPGSDTYSDTGITAVTETDGYYIFEELVLDVNYKVLFPDKNPIAFTAKANDSHVNPDGFTDAVMPEWDNPDQEVNAGYKDGFGFGKMVKDAEGNYVLNTTLTNKDELIWYELKFKLPDNMSTIESVSIRDILPEQLQLTDVSEIIIQIDGTDPAAGIGTLNYESESSLLVYEFDSSRLTELAGKAVTMEIPVKLNSSLTGAPDGQIINKGELIINDKIITPPVDPIIDVEISGTISGILWADENEDGILDSSEVIRYAGETVKLYAEDSAGSGTYSDTGLTAVTGDNGKYIFYDLDGDINYKVYFPDKTPIGYTVKQNDSHAGADGFSDAVMLTIDEQTLTVNAGYKDGFRFAKKVKDADGNYVNSTIVTEKDATIWYELSFKLPDNMSAITGLRIQDTLPAELELIGESEVIMKLNGLTADNGTGVLGYDNSTKILSYTFNSTKLADLAGQTVTMEVPVKLSSSLTGSPAGNIVNKGELIINDNTITPPIDPPVEVDVKGSIKGILWADENRNGFVDAEESTRYADKEVKLYMEDGSGSDSYIDTGLAVRTESDGSYVFNGLTLDTNYKVKFPDIASMQITVKANENHANADGFSDAFTPDWDQQEITANAGYFQIQMPKDFRKQLLNEQGDPVDKVQVSNPETEVVKFLITFETGEMSGYQTMELVDQLDERLEFVGLEITDKAGNSLDSFGEYQISQDNKLVFTFHTPLDTERLANELIKVAVAVRVKADLSNYDNITNTAKLIVNNDVEIDTNGEPEIELNYGFVRGYVFKDENKNNIRDNADTPIAGAEIRLEKRAGDSWNYIGSTRSKADGSYSFDKEVRLFHTVASNTSAMKALSFGDYRVTVIPQDMTDMEFVVRQAGGNQMNGVGSDVDANGMAEFKISSQTREPLPSAGIKAVDGPVIVEPPIIEPPVIIPPVTTPEEKDGGEDAKQVFKKMPLDKIVYPGKTVDYTFSGFGNDTGKTVEKYSITDIFPEGLHFESAKIPAFKNGEGLVYEITYITNLSGRRVLYSDVPADKAFSFDAPKLQEGEWIMYLSLRMDAVPDGFGINDTIIFTCRVDENPPARYLVNDAVLGYDGIDIYARTQAIQIGEVPETGDHSNIRLYLCFAVVGIMGIIHTEKKRRNSKKNTK